MISILFIISTLRPSGPVNVLLNINKHLKRDRFLSRVLTLSPEPEKSLLPEFQKANVPVHSLGLSRLQGIVQGCSDLKRFVTDYYSPDVVHTHGLRADALSSTCLQDFKRISTIHNYPYVDYLMKYGKLRGWVMAWWHLYVLRRIDFPVACSETIARRLLRHSFKTIVIRNGIEGNLYTPSESEEQVTLRKRLRLPVDRTIFVYVGSLIPRKDPKTMIEGFLTSQARHNSKLLVIGEGPLRDSCETLAEGESAIQFVGHVSNVVDYLQAADYFVSSSLSEGLPNAVLEAMACGLPVCLSNIDSHQEILSLGKEAGVLFESGNSKSLADAMDRLIKADRALMTKKSLEIVENYLNAEQMSAQYQNLYARRISGGQTG